MVILDHEVFHLAVGGRSPDGRSCSWVWMLRCYLLIKARKERKEIWTFIFSSVFSRVERMKEETPPTVPISMLPAETEAEGRVQEGPECQQRR